jgi:hypothetical protein
MGQTAPVPVVVERATRAWPGRWTKSKQQQGHTTHPEHAMDLSDHSDRIGQVLEHMGRDHEVDAPVRHLLKPVDVEVGLQVGLGKHGTVELREQRPIFGR